MNRQYYKQIWILTLPILIENILQTLLSTVDRYFAGSIGDSAIAAIGVTEIVMNIYIAFFIALNVGTSAILSRSIGKQDEHHANEVARQAIILSSFVGLLVGVMSLILAKPLLQLTGATEDIMVYALPYFYAVAVPSVFLSLSLTLSACLRSAKDTKTPMILSSASNVLNVVLNILFMSMGMGIFGLGLATTIARVALTIAFFIVLLHKKHGIHLHLQRVHLNRKILHGIASIGIPAGVEKLVMRVGQLVYTGMIISLGTNAYVSHSIAGTLESCTYISTMSFASAVAVLMGISLGENRKDKADIYVWLSNKFNLVLMVIFAVSFMIFAEPLAGLFTDTPEVIASVKQLIVVMAFTTPFVSTVYIVTGALQGAGDTKFPLYTTFVGIWVIRIGFGYLFGTVFDLGILGVWFAISLDIILRAIVLVIRYKRGHWLKELDVYEAVEESA
ncbi:MATE family efflux transporter [Chakrabartyella piscis]|uniref:MATE family efflux transporter n=1 Tax=Chakrabartyella piscis TaxID=2918914 RepID=UPI00295837E3|nr:MATE family efflux transporter [Chakrabartyella piscis]